MVSPNGTLHIANGKTFQNNIQINNDMTITGENQQNTIINVLEKRKHIQQIVTSGI